MLILRVLTIRLLGALIALAAERLGPHLIQEGRGADMATPKILALGFAAAAASMTVGAAPGTRCRLSSWMSRVNSIRPSRTPLAGGTVAGGRPDRVEPVLEPK